MDHRLSDGPITLDVAFDELNLSVNVSYNGRAISLPERAPAAAELLERDSASLELAGYLVRHYADASTAECRDGRCQIRLDFAHA